MAGLAYVCRRYYPRPNGEGVGPLGYKDAGTLVAFGHGCPNTTPRVFWASSRHGRALFPDRSAASSDRELREADVVSFAAILAKMGSGGLAGQPLLSRLRSEPRKALLVLAAVSHGLHDAIPLATRTGLALPAVDRLLEAFRTADWIDDRGVITVAGLAELRAARRVAPSTRGIPPDRVSMYFPKSLRG